MLFVKKGTRLWNIQFVDTHAYTVGGGVIIPRTKVQHCCRCLVAVAVRWKIWAEPGKKCPCLVCVCVCVGGGGGTNSLAGIWRTEPNNANRSENYNANRLEEARTLSSACMHARSSKIHRAHCVHCVRSLQATYTVTTTEQTDFPVSAFFSAR